MEYTSFHDKADKELDGGYFSVLDLMHKMQKDSPEERPSALETLNFAINRLKILDPAGTIKDSVIYASTMIINLNSTDFDEASTS